MIQFPKRCDVQALSTLPSRAYTESSFGNASPSCVWDSSFVPRNEMSGSSSEIEHREHAATNPKNLPRARARAGRLFAEDLFDESPKKTPPPSPLPETEIASPPGMTEEVYRRAATFMARPLHIKSFGRTHVYRARFTDHDAPAIVLRETLGHYEAEHTPQRACASDASSLSYVGLASFTAALLEATRKATEPHADEPRIRAWMNQLG